MHHPQKRLKQTHLFGNAPSTNDAEVTAVVYSWTFIPPFDHVLRGCSYFGQTMQSFATRTAQHKARSLHHPSELGLHALWRQYPHDDHWDINALQTRCFTDRLDACTWMNDEERRLIEAHGGMLRDMDKRLVQTLNLTKGGQGNSRAVWEGILAHSRRRLAKVWSKLERYYNDHKHLRIPRNDPVLGHVVHDIRARSRFLHHADFRTWLDDRHFVYDERRAHLELDVWPKLERYYNDHKHLRIPRNDPVLGHVVHDIRARSRFLHHADFAMWLWCACFEMHTRDDKENRLRWERVFDKLPMVAA